MGIKEMMQGSGQQQEPVWELFGLKPDSVVKIPWGALQQAKPEVRARFVAVIKELLPELFTAPE